MLDDFRRLELLRGGKRDVVKQRQDKGHRAELARFVRVAAGDEAPPPLAGYAASTRATLALAESLRTGAPVPALTSGAPPMKIWVDLANSPHVPFFVPVVAGLRGQGHEVVLSARDHAQTVELAAQRGLDATVIGGDSPARRLRKGAGIAGRAMALRRFARAQGVDVALSHGSYAQLLAARAARVPAVTMMDYEFQPANHLSFRLARRVIVPDAFPAGALRRFGARGAKVVRYAGFKEELYLDGFEPDPGVLDVLGLDPARVIAVFRPPPEGALYHQMGNDRFEAVLDEAAGREDVQAVLLCRTAQQRSRYAGRNGLRAPEHAVDALSLLALADIAIGGGGTMTRESALLGTPTYTVFAGRLASVDAELIRQHRLHDLRDERTQVVLRKRGTHTGAPAANDGGAIMEAIEHALHDVVRDRTRRAEH